MIGDVRLSHTTTSNEDINQELTLPEIHEKYKDRWIALVITRRDENLQPTAGTVVADDVDRYRLRSKLVAYTDICIFHTGDCPYPLLL